jgi:hypothetical protein
MVRTLRRRAVPVNVVAQPFAFGRQAGGNHPRRVDDPHGHAIMLGRYANLIEIHHSTEQMSVLLDKVSGLILIMLGVAGEYLRRILDALSDRPEAAIDETFLWTGAAGGT